MKAFLWLYCVPKVFNLNAPVPPTNEADGLKQFPSGYGQGFSSQAEHSVEEPDIQQDTLQSGEKGTGVAVGVEDVI